MRRGRIRIVDIGNNYNDDDKKNVLHLIADDCMQVFEEKESLQFKLFVILISIYHCNKSLKTAQVHSFFEKYDE